MSPQGVLVLGAGGMLGQALVGEAQRRSLPVAGVTRQQVDLVDTGSVETALDEIGPEVVVNGAAFTQVDQCEEEEERATEINGYAVGRAAAACAARGVRFLQVSTDYVFDGSATEPYRESHPTAPLQAYGRGKLVGEESTRTAGGAVVRTSWLFGPGGPNFVQTMLKLAGDRTVLDVVDDQVGCPTYTPFLAQGLLDLAWSDLWDLPSSERVVHYSNPEPVSWNGFARAIFDEAKLTMEVRPVPTSTFPRPAERPRYSVLSTERTEALIGGALPPWRQGLRSYLAEGTP
ncbi:MAG: dTDP-4-dehydrorhamnose reductase [Acidobacteriota bacterium]